MNTRKLIEGLYRQKFQMILERELFETQQKNLPRTKDNVDKHKKFKSYMHHLSEREAMIDELLIEFFGE